MRIGWAVVAAGALVAAACTESNAPAGPLGPLAEIVDGSNGGGNASFFWLPPLVLGPVQAGTNVTGLAPEVTIFQCTGGDCGNLSAEPVADFTTETGPGSETVRDGGDHYVVNWHTNDAVTGTSIAGGTYRICVGLQVNDEQVTLGHADVLVGDNGKAVKNARTDDSVPLVNQSTLPINFRIEAGYESGGSEAGCGGGGGGASLSGDAATFNPDSQPLANAPVTLFDASGDLLTSVNTTAQGLYSFPDLSPGSYTVCMQDVDFLFLPGADGSCPSGSSGFDVEVMGATVQDFHFYGAT